MKFNDIGIIISVQNYSENSMILKLFSHNHGIYRGFVSAKKSTKNNAVFQVGNLISFEWRSRIEEALGQFYYIDLEKSFLTKIIFDKLKLSCCSSLFSIIDSCFLERENHQSLFEKLLDFLQKISVEEISKKNLLAEYIRLELKILKVLGYGVDLSSCVVTNSNENLAFVSPKSAQAVSFDAGKQYADKLLKLPPFLIPNDDISQYALEINDSHLQDGLKLSGYFLEKFVFAQKSVRPKGRNNIECELRN